MITRPPLATYRLQFNKDFRFKDAEALIPYLLRLGITHVYASPVFAAKAGSMHGYDITDPTMPNPELGTQAEFDSLLAALRKAGLGLVLDIVPNHMSADAANPWWWDVLLHGSESPYASYFDIAWEAGQGKVVLPVLGKPLEDALAAGEIRVVEHPGGYAIAYFDRRWPVRAESRDLAAKASTGDRDAVAALLDAQAYRPVHYREPPNYRRFFDINDLASVRVEDQEVFAATHGLINGLVSEGAVAGLRVDHIDGLSDPAAYLRQLRAASGRGTYLVVEKVLGEGEQLPSGWPVEGTTGYDFLAMVNGLFASREGLAALGRAYARFTGIRHGFDEEVRTQKRRMLRMLFSHEVEALSRLVAEVLQDDFSITDVSQQEVFDILVEATARMSVYRTYADRSGMPELGVRVVERAFKNTPRAGGGDSIVDAVRRVLTLAYPPGLPAKRQEAWVGAVRRWQQLSGPATAKGLEDTAFYRYNRLISLNEVGGHARALTPGRVHRFLRTRARRWPHSMNASSTHDTKRSEDVRARINVLSWMAGDWVPRVERWRRWNARWKRDVDGVSMPDANMEWLLYQTLVGAWPLDGEGRDDFLPRLQRFLVKAAREAKEHTSWLQVNEAYEEALVGFAQALLDPARSPGFLRDLGRFVARIAPVGAAASLAQLVIKATAPGVPDFYQGQELWDFSMTDPDNRRPVDYARRASAMAEVEVMEGGPSVSALAEHWRDGRLKLYVTRKLLALRQEKAALFQRGDYLPLETSRDSVFAYARRDRGYWLVTVVSRPRLAGKGDGRLPVGRRLGEATTVVLPRKAASRWRNLLTGETLTCRGGRFQAAAVLRDLPAAVLEPVSGWSHGGVEL